MKKIYLLLAIIGAILPYIFFFHHSESCDRFELRIARLSLC